MVSAWDIEFGIIGGFVISVFSGPIVLTVHNLLDSYWVNRSLVKHARVVRNGVLTNFRTWSTGDHRLPMVNYCCQLSFVAEVPSEYDSNDEKNRSSKKTKKSNNISHHSNAKGTNHDNKQRGSVVIDTAGEKTAMMRRIDNDIETDNHIERRREGSSSSLSCSHSSHSSSNPSTHSSISVTLSNHELVITTDDMSEGGGSNNHQAPDGDHHEFVVHTTEKNHNTIMDNNNHGNNDDHHYHKMQRKLVVSEKYLLSEKQFREYFRVYCIFGSVTGVSITYNPHNLQSFVFSSQFKNFAAVHRSLSSFISDNRTAAIPLTLAVFAWIVGGLFFGPLSIACAVAWIVVLSVMGWILSDNRNNDNLDKVSKDNNNITSSMSTTNHSNKNNNSNKGYYLCSSTTRWCGCLFGRHSGSHTTKMRKQRKSVLIFDTHLESPPIPQFRPTSSVDTLRVMKQMRRVQSEGAYFQNHHGYSSNQFIDGDVTVDYSANRPHTTQLIMKPTIMNAGNWDENEMNDSELPPPSTLGRNASGSSCSSSTSSSWMMSAGFERTQSQRQQILAESLESLLFDWTVQQSESNESINVTNVLKLAYKIDSERMLNEYESLLKTGVTEDSKLVKKMRKLSVKICRDIAGDQIGGTTRRSQGEGPTTTHPAAAVAVAAAAAAAVASASSLSSTTRSSKKKKKSKRRDHSSPSHGTSVSGAAGRMRRVRYGIRKKTKCSTPSVSHVSAHGHGGGHQHNYNVENRVTRGVSESDSLISHHPRSEKTKHLSGEDERTEEVGSLDEDDGDGDDGHQQSHPKLSSIVEEPIHLRPVVSNTNSSTGVSTTSHTRSGHRSSSMSDDTTDLIHSHGLVFGQTSVTAVDSSPETPGAY